MWGSSSETVGKVVIHIDSCNITARKGTRDSNFCNEEQGTGAKSRISNSQKLFGKNINNLVRGRRCGS